MQWLAICGYCHLASMLGNKNSQVTLLQKEEHICQFANACFWFAVDNMDTLACHSPSLLSQPDLIILRVTGLLSLWVHYFSIKNIQLDLKKNEQLKLIKLSFAFLLHLALLPSGLISDATPTSFLTKVFKWHTCIFA